MWGRRGRHILGGPEGRWLGKGKDKEPGEVGGGVGEEFQELGAQQGGWCDGGP